MKIVIDSSPLLSLAVIGQLELFQTLFTSFMIPQAVFDEMMAAKDDRRNSEVIAFVEKRVHKVQGSHKVVSNLGAGETEAIALCLETNADILIIDDMKARALAESYDIKCIGTLGVLTLAKKKGFINQMRKYFLQLIESDRYFSIKLLNRILESNQEQLL